jgi:hypothetical protein
MTLSYALFLQSPGNGFDAFFFAVAGLMLISSLFYVFYIPFRVDAGEEKTRLAYLRERKEVVYDNMRDLNFEHRAGKLSDADYESLRTSMEDEAAAILSEITRLEEAAYAVPSTSDRKGAKA